MNKRKTETIVPKVIETVKSGFKDIYRLLLCARKIENTEQGYEWKKEIAIKLIKTANELSECKCCFGKTEETIWEKCDHCGWRKI